MKINVLALDGVFDTGLATVLDAFAIANELAAMSGLESPRFDVTVTGMRRRVRTAQGLGVPVAAAERKRRRIGWWCRRSAARCRRRSSMR